MQTSLLEFESEVEIMGSLFKEKEEERLGNQKTILRKCIFFCEHQKQYLSKPRKRKRREIKS